MKVSFQQGERAFHTDLKAAVNQYFSKNQISPYSNFKFRFKSAVLFGAALATYALILSNTLTERAMLLCCVLLGLLWSGIGFNIAHDACHGAYSKNPWVNRLLGKSMNLIGLSDYVWDIKHNILHHTYPNVKEIDYDLRFVRWIRLSPFTQWLRIHRIQPFLAPFAYMILSLGWIFFHDFLHLYLFQTVQKRRHRFGDLVAVIIWKAVYISYTLILPYLILDLAFWKILIGFLVAHIVFSFVSAIVFQLAHVLEETEHVAPQGGKIAEEWAIHQLKTTANFSRNNRFLTWFLGGLNFQIEHHLFPKVCSVHYPKISVLVEETARKHNLTYICHPSLSSAVSSHWKFLQRMSSPSS